MKDHTKTYVSLLTLFIALVIFVQTNVLTIMIFELKGTTKQVAQTGEIEPEEKIKEWKLKIPKIDVSGNIEEGTEEETINNSIGHFTNTPYLDGNVGLIAGCYGYKENYFADLEKLEQGDVILYQYGDQKKEYKVIHNNIIDQKDWSYLSSTNENKLTLITGVVNEPEKRRCVQAEEIK
ncbi:MAG: sortase [Clostridia bacterium]|nr:sortase [Clostridia bacterium]